MRRLAALPAAALAAAALAGCGTPPADLFVIERAGEVPGAGLRLHVSDGGTVRCNDGPERRLPSDVLLDARELARELVPVLERRLDLPVPANAVLRYRVRGEGGGARFADASPRLPDELRDLAALTRRIAKGACGLPR